MLISQIQLFILFLINGILIGFIWDFFRALRKVFKTKDFITYIEDIIFWILTGIIVLYSIFKFNNGEIRFYIFFAIITGIIIYINLLSIFFIKVNFLFLRVIKKILIFFLKINSILIKLIKIIFKKPISFIIINIRKITKIHLKKTKNTNNI